MNTPTIKDWIGAMRLRTLALAVACILMGSFLAYFYHDFHVWVLVFSLLTTICLQVLSNLANDYGDSIHGADNADRKGPSRAVQSGKISKPQMKKAIIIFSLLSVLFGTLLVFLAPISRGAVIVFQVLGLLAIAAAINYTIGKRPYGYRGFGDIAVFVFFGLIAVLGTFYLHTSHFHWDTVLPASSTGLLAVAVLNVNNIRDIESDVKAGKRSLAVKWGRKNAVIYHYLLLLVAVILAFVFVSLNYRSISQHLFILSIPMFIRNAIAVTQLKDQEQLDPFLKQMAISTLVFVLLFGLGHALTV